MTGIRTARPEYHKNGQLELVLGVGGTQTNGATRVDLSPMLLLFFSPYRTLSVSSSPAACLSVRPNTRRVRPP